MGVDHNISRRDFLKIIGGGVGGLGLWAAGFRPVMADAPPTPIPIPIEISAYSPDDDLSNNLDKFSSTWQGVMMGAVKNPLSPNTTTDLSSVFQTLIDKIVNHVGNECNNNPRKNGNHDVDVTRLFLETLAYQMTPEQFMEGVDEILVLNKNYIKQATSEQRWEQVIFIKHRFTQSNGKVSLAKEQSWSIFNFKQAGNFGKNGEYILSSSGTNFYTDKIPAGLSNAEKAKLAREMQSLRTDLSKANKIYSKVDGITVIRTIKDRLKQSPLSRAAADYKPINGSPSNCTNPDPKSVPVVVEAPQLVPQSNSQSTSEFVWQPVTVATETAGFTMAIALALLGGAIAFRTRMA